MRTHALFIVVASAASTLAVEPPVELVAKTYTKSLERVTDKPKHVGREFALLCKPVDPAIPKKKYGEHLYRHVHYLRNDLAKQPGDKFPTGAIIVKEKLAGEDGAKAKVGAVAGMIKRAPGTSPKTGDWEFFWFEGGKVSTAAAQSCAGCHSGAKRDYVFSDLPKPAGK